jgi:hypothetical protein
LARKVMYLDSVSDLSLDVNHIKVMVYSK